MKFLNVGVRGYTFKRGEVLEILPRVSRILEWKYGPIKCDPKQLAVLAAFGTAVHQGLAGKRIKNDVAKDYVEQGFKYLDDHKLRTKKIEFRVHSLKWRFAGTPDRWCHHPRYGGVLVDWKTGGVSKGHAEQINLYALACWESYAWIPDHLVIVELQGKRYKLHAIEKNFTKAIRTVEEFHKSEEGGTV